MTVCNIPPTDAYNQHWMLAMHPHTSRSRSKTVCSIVVLKNNTVHAGRKLCKYLAAVASPSGSRETISSPPLEDISIVSVGLWASWVCQFLPCNQLTPQHRARHCIASRFRLLLLWCFFSPDALRQPRDQREVMHHLPLLSLRFTRRFLAGTNWKVRECKNWEVNDFFQQFRCSKGWSRGAACCAAATTAVYCSVV